MALPDISIKPKKTPITAEERPFATLYDETRGGSYPIGDYPGYEVTGETGTEAHQVK